MSVGHGGSKNGGGGSDAEDLAAVTSRLVGERVVSSRRLSGGCIADVRLVELASGERVVVKRGGCPAVEAMMLRTLAERSSLPVPEVLAEGDGVLVVSYVPSGGRLCDGSERHAADLVAALHRVGAADHGRGGPGGASFGFESDTLIGPLRQPNGWRVRWVDFFREQRLVAMARTAYHADRLPVRVFSAVERLAEGLDERDCPPPRGAGGGVGRLLHGDCWTGNVLVSPGGERIAGFIDPAVYHGHPEIELAFTTLFGTFGPVFFERYAAVSDAVDDWDGFWDRRCDLYNLYPLLVHVCLFGGGYVQQVEAVVKRLGSGRRGRG